MANPLLANPLFANPLLANPMFLVPWPERLVGPAIQSSIEKE
jgi:hypothetical protein